MASLYEDLAKILFNIQPAPSVKGTWGPTTGVLGYINPFSRDYGATELARELADKTPSGELTTKFNNPAVYNQPATANTSVGTYQTVAPGAALPSGWNTSRYEELKEIAEKGDLNPAQKTEWNALNAGGSTGSTKTKEELEKEAYIKAQQGIAKSKYDEGLRRAAEYLSSAQTYTDKMKGIIGDKRGEFEKMFDEARGQIGTSAGQRIGEAGRASESLATSVGNRARALGLTGTTAQSMMNRPQDALARDIFNINQQRTANENENRRLLGERQDWATGQEAELDQYLRNVANEAQSMRNTSYLDYWDNLSNLDQKLDNYIGNMIKAQNQAALMAPSIQGYDTSAYSPEFANTMNSLQGLKSGINSMYLNQTPTAGDDAATLVGEDDMQKLLKRFI